MAVARYPPIRFSELDSTAHHEVDGSWSNFRGRAEVTIFQGLKSQGLKSKTFFAQAADSRQGEGLRDQGALDFVDKIGGAEGASTTRGSAGAMIKLLITAYIGVL